MCQQIIYALLSKKGIRIFVKTLFYAHSNYLCCIVCSGGYKEENGIRVCFETDLTPSSDRDDSNGFSLISK